MPTGPALLNKLNILWAWSLYGEIYRWSSKGGGHQWKKLAVADSNQKTPTELLSVEAGELGLENEPEQRQARLEEAGGNHGTKPDEGG